MKTALLLIACWLLALIPLDQGITPLVVLLFNPDRTLYGTAQLTGFAGILLTLYLANLGVEVVLRRRFQIAGMLALLAAWLAPRLSTAKAQRVINVLVGLVMWVIAFQLAKDGFAHVQALLN